MTRAYRLLLSVAGLLAAGGIQAGFQIVENIEQLDVFERHVAEEHLHGVDLSTLEAWVKLGNAACAAEKKRTTRALVIGTGEFSDPDLYKLDTSNNTEYVRIALRARGVTQLTLLRGDTATYEAINEGMTNLLAASRCGDRIVFTWAGTGLLMDSRNLGPHAANGTVARPVSIMPAFDANYPCGEGGDACAGWFSSHDLVDFVTVARNRGVEVVLLMDACHGIDLAGQGREAVWELPDTARGMFSLRQDAAEFAAFFAARPDSVAFNTSIGPSGSIGAFTLAIATALQDPIVRTPRALGSRVVEMLERIQPNQLPMIQASDPDMTLFGEARGTGTRGLNAEFDITEPQATRGVVVVSAPHLKVSGRLNPIQGLIAVSVNGLPAQLSADGSFEARVELRQGENLVMVSGWYDDRSFKTESFTVIHEEDATAALREGARYAILIGVQDYDDPAIRDLDTPLADVSEMARVLTASYGFSTALPGDERVDTLFLRNPTRGEIVSALERLVQTVREEDSVLVYFAGHSAVPEGLKQAYWLPANAGEKDITEWIESDRIRTTIKRMAARSVLVVSDSCYSAALTAREVDGTEHAQDLGRAQFLLRMASERSRILIASGNLEPVADGGGSGHSVFARALLDRLGKPPQRGFTSTELFAPIQERVAGNSRQAPQRSIFRDSGHNGGDFVFFRVGG